MTEHEEARPKGPIDHKVVATKAAVFVPVLKKVQAAEDAANESASGDCPLLIVQVRKGEICGAWGMCCSRVEDSREI